jgi:hypothetical protein
MDEPASSPRQATPFPLVVELDGTLTASDPLAEGLLRIAKNDAAGLLPVALSRLAGEAAFREAVAVRARIEPSALPYRGALVEYLREQRSLGRHIALATRSHVSVARDVAAYLNVFDTVLGSEDGRSLSGKSKLDACRERLCGSASRRPADLA